MPQPPLRLDDTPIRTEAPDLLGALQVSVDRARTEAAVAFCRRRAAENLAGWDAVALVLAELDRCREQLAVRSTSHHTAHAAPQS